MEDDLEKYRKKRHFEKTPEPKPEKAGSKIAPIFVIQKHWATRLHYDFRIELNGVLKSWAVPKGISMNPEDKQLAVMVEDHPFDYKNFEGEIPEGEYGAGTVRIWDQGTYVAKDVEAGLKKGHIYLFLNGRKAKGGFNLVKMNDKNWLLLKANDEFSGQKIKEDVFKYKELEEKAKKIDLSKAKKSAMSNSAKPMTAESIIEPFDDDDWIFEIKWDGYRAISFLRNGKVELKSRNNLSMDYFPKIESELKEFPLEVIFDGEVVALNKKGLPDFQLLQNYIKSQKGKIVYYVFDTLYLNNYNLTSLPLFQRKEILKQLIPSSPFIKFADHVEKLGKQFFSQAKKAGLEGIIAKNKRSSYQEGKRSKLWLKIKSEQQQEMIICGFTQPRLSRKYIGELIMGAYENNEFIYCGHCGTGFTEETLKELYEKMKPLTTDECPFKIVPKTNEPAVWLKPRLVCQVKFAEWTDEGIMRAPVFLGLREDKDPKEVKRESFYPEIKQLKVKLTNLDKVFWKDEGYTKKDLIDYYEKISPVLFPYLKDRPIVLHRFPHGADGESFFQKNAISEKMDLPDWIKTQKISSEEGEINYIVCNSPDTIVYLANLGCITMHPWNSRIQNLENPDYAVLDYDAKESTFEKAVKVVFEAHKILEDLEIKHYLKTSGGSGLHIFIPLFAKYSHKQAQDFAKIINQLTFLKTKEFATLVRNPKKRDGKVYLDYLQNGVDKTLASVYSVRPRPLAPVSMPIKWKELGKIKTEDFTMKNAFERLDRVGDLWQGLFSESTDIKKVLEKIQKWGLL
jgi:bifunctional non-homologous end joining protein LigD